MRAKRYFTFYKPEDFTKMKRNIILPVLLVCLSVTAFAQKDINAWKSETTIEQQYEVFKENLNFWDGKYFMTPPQLDAYYNALSDSVAELENEIAARASRINELEEELAETNGQLEDTQAELDTSIENRNSISIFGLEMGKGTYPLTMTVIIIALLALLGFLFMLYKRSHNVTARTKKDYKDLKEEFETHKKNALDRYTKINTELHHTRMKLKNQ
jgi:DNA repair exonuclease SbcCD ATPase subunit